MIERRKYVRRDATVGRLSAIFLEDIADQEFRRRTRRSVGRGDLQAGDTAFHAVPDEVYLEGTLRTCDEREREIIHQRIRNIAAEIDTTVASLRTYFLRSIIFFKHLSVPYRCHDFMQKAPANADASLV